MECVQHFADNHGPAFDGCSHACKRPLCQVGVGYDYQLLAYTYSCPI